MTDGQHDLIWRKSRSCANGACIEVASAGARFLVRDSKDPDGGCLAFAAADWGLFVEALKHVGLSARVD